MTSRASSAAVAWLIAAAIGAAGMVHAQERAPRSDYDSGPALYRTFCASCHGPQGRGDGPVADLGAAKPTDLTALARANAGLFPRARIERLLAPASDGGDRYANAAAHPAMPDWGAVLRQIAQGDDRATRARVAALVTHLESLQK